MSHIRRSGRIPDTFIDRSIYDLTFRVVSPVSWNAKDILTILDGVIDVSDISDIWKSDFSWNVTVTSPEAAKILCDVDILSYKNIDVRLECFNQQNIKVKVHWLPPYVKDEFLRSYFSRYGLVKSVEREASVISAEATKRSGIRTVTIVTDRDKASEIPHLHSFDGGITMLLTIGGRLPLCLRCRNLGHVRKDCPLSKRRDQPLISGPPPASGPRSYSNVVDPSSGTSGQSIGATDPGLNVQVNDEDHNDDDISHAENENDDDDQDHVMESESQTNKRKDRDEDTEPHKNCAPQSEDQDDFTDVENKKTKSAKKKIK